MRSKCSVLGSGLGLINLTRSWFGWKSISLGMEGCPLLPCELSICSSVLCSDPSSCLIRNKSRQNALTCLPVSLVEPAEKEEGWERECVWADTLCPWSSSSFFYSCSMMELPNLTAPHFTAFRCL